MFKISIITGEARLENVGLCLISPFYPSVRHLGAAYIRGEDPCPYSIRQQHGEWGPPFPPPVRKRLRTLQIWTFTRAGYPPRQPLLLLRRAVKGKKKTASILSREGWSLSSFSHSIIWCKNTVSGKESVSIRMHLAASNRNLKLNRVEHYGNIN